MNCEEPADHWQDVEQGRPVDHLAGADGGGQEHVDHAQGCAGQAGHGSEPVELGLGEFKAQVVEFRGDCVGEEPDGKAEDEGEGRDREGSPCDLGTPVFCFFGIPSL